MNHSIQISTTPTLFKRTSLAAASIALAAMLAGCSLQDMLPGASANQASATTPQIIHEGAFVIVPEGSPLRAGIQVSEVVLEDFSSSIDAPATIGAVPEKLVKITPPLTGRIVRLHRQLGDSVKAGDALATIDAPDLGAAYSEQIKAQAALAQAQQVFDRQKELYESHIASKKDFDEAQLELSFAQTEARATADKIAQLGAAVDASSRREYVLRSPIAGRVVEMEGAQGGFWNDTAASIMTVADLSTVWLSASVSEKDLPQMYVGQSANITLNAYPDRQFTGKVKYIGDLLDPETRTTQVRVAVSNREGRFKPGMFARVQFAGQPQRAVLVPAAALLQSGLYTRVFVEKEPFKFESRVVRLGTSAQDKVEVVAGLKAGERIVVKDGVLLND